MPLSPREIEELAVNASVRAASRMIEEAAEEAARRSSLDADQLDDIVSNAVRQTLLQLGIDAANPLEMQRDFQHLREWRKAGTEIKTKGLLALLGLFLTGAAGLLVLGLKETFSK